MDLLTAARRADLKSEILNVLLDAREQVDGVSVLREILGELAPEPDAEDAAEAAPAGDDGDEEPAYEIDDAIFACVRDDGPATHTEIAARLRGTVSFRNSWSLAVGLDRLRRAERLDLDIDGAYHVHPMPDPSLAPGFRAEPALLAMLMAGPTERRLLTRANGTSHRAAAWSANALTSLVRKGLVERVGAGLYRLTVQGDEQARAHLVTSTPSEAPSAAQVDDEPASPPEPAATGRPAPIEGVGARTRKQAILDALGLAAEGMTAEQIMARFGVFDRAERKRWHTTLSWLVTQGHDLERVAGRYVLARSTPAAPAASALPTHPEAVEDEPALVNETAPPSPIDVWAERVVRIIGDKGRASSREIAEALDVTAAADQNAIYKAIAALCRQRVLRLAPFDSSRYEILDADVQTAIASGA